MSQTKNVNRILFVTILVLISILLYSQESIPKYYNIQVKFNHAVSEYDNSKYKIASKLFKEIIAADTTNFYWESNIYLSNIYQESGFPDSAKIVIERSLQKKYNNLNAEKMLATTQKALELNRRIDIHSYETYEDIITELYPISLHIFPDKIPEPIDGIENFCSQLIDCIPDSIIKQIKDDRIYLNLAVDNKGVVGRVKIGNNNISDQTAKKLLIVSYDSKWKPAIFKNKPIGWTIVVPIEVDKK